MGFFGQQEKWGEGRRNTIEGLTTSCTEATGGTVEFFDFGGELLHEFAHVKLLLADHVLGNFWKKVDRRCYIENENRKLTLSDLGLLRLVNVLHIVELSTTNLLVVGGLAEWTHQGWIVELSFGEQLAESFLLIGEWMEEVDRFATWLLCALLETLIVLVDSHCGKHSTEVDVFWDGVGVETLWADVDWNNGGNEDFWSKKNFLAPDIFVLKKITQTAKLT
ncbi:hypothetical protein GCK72_008717 [Caenorhabditis remanei]|uniref:Uncharacterized protein n=1 Tax=Caenorhabditis remanei TaxID=31234 RepID=A0A6A5GYB8_CAERE|nr:hypothetical protein GCK72_008717 [Caenorhabditis remanei]KAF1760468.1 hypothetical protein GCK72_008717 [Caenorhabditis remanei]